QDVDGVYMTSRLSQLAPVSFTNTIDGQRRRRLYALDSWETNNIVYANDNPAGPDLTASGGATLRVGTFYNNSRFSAHPPAQGHGPPFTNPDYTPPQADATLLAANTYNKNNPYPTYTPSLAHRDKKINLNYPLPVSNDPNEPVRQKWISETYYLL